MACHWAIRIVGTLFAVPVFGWESRLGRAVSTRASKHSSGVSDA